MIISLYSAAPRSGKTTGANYLAARLDEARVISFASPLKAVTNCFLAQAGLSEERILFYRQEAKEEPIPQVCNRSIRQLDQWLGTEFGRQLVGPDIWVNLWKARVSAARKAGVKHIICDDLRFWNEGIATQEVGGITVAIVRSKALAVPKTTLQHASEGGLADWKFNAVVCNEGTVPEFCVKLREVIENV